MAAMDSTTCMDAHELGELARFLDNHPAFSPEFCSDDAILSGFQIGDCVLTIEQMLYILHTPLEAPEPALAAVYSEWAGGI